MKRRIQGKIHRYKLEVLSMAREKRYTPVVSYDQSVLQKFTCLSANQNWITSLNPVTQRRPHARQYMARLDKKQFPNGRLTPPAMADEAGAAARAP